MTNQINQIINKPYDQVLNDNNDPQSRSKIISVFNNKGLTLIDGPQYGIDLITPCKTIGIELERKPRWLDSSSPLTSNTPFITLLARKSKYFLGTSYYYCSSFNNIFILYLSSDLSSCMVIDRPTILPYLTDQYKIAKSSYINNNNYEYYYTIPTECWKYIRL